MSDPDQNVWDFLDGVPEHTGPHDRPYYRCLKCGAVSYHPEDIEQSYCGRCHQWAQE
jgi:ribosomal protein L37E